MITKKENISLAELIGTPLAAGERYYDKGGKCDAKADVESGFTGGIPTHYEMAAEVAQLRFEMEMIRMRYPSIFPNSALARNAKAVKIAREYTPDEINALVAKAVADALAKK